MEVEATQIDKDEEDTQMGSQTDDAKRQAEEKISPVKKKHRAKSACKDLPFGYTPLDLGGSGDCAYRCLAVSYALQTNRPLEERKAAAKSLGATLRAQVSSHLRKHHHFRDGWTPDRRWSETTEGGTIPRKLW